MALTCWIKYVEKLLYLTLVLLAVIPFQLCPVSYLLTLALTHGRGSLLLWRNLGDAGNFSLLARELTLPPDWTALNHKLELILLAAVVRQSLTDWDILKYIVYPIECMAQILRNFFLRTALLTKTWSLIFDHFSLVSDLDAGWTLFNWKPTEGVVVSSLADTLALWGSLR